MSPEHREIFIHGLALQTLRALGVHGKSPTSEQILDHTIVQACIEIEAVEKVLDGLQDHPELSTQVYILQGIRHRLELAQEHNETLADLIAECANDCGAVNG